MIVEFLDVAESEVDDGFEYYQLQYDGLGFEFIDELRNAINRIVANPNAWQKNSPRTRKCLLHRFPYGVVYQIRTESILVVAVACNHRKPNYWVGRASS